MFRGVFDAVRLGARTPVGEVALADVVALDVGGHEEVRVLHQHQSHPTLVQRVRPRRKLVKPETRQLYHVILLQMLCSAL